MYKLGDKFSVEEQSYFSQEAFGTLRLKFCVAYNERKEKIKKRDYVDDTTMVGRIKRKTKSAVVPFTQK